MNKPYVDMQSLAATAAARAEGQHALQLVCLTGAKARQVACFVLLS